MENQSFEQQPEERLAPFEVAPNAERETIREQLEQEYRYRVTILTNALDVLKLSHGDVIIAPPVLDRTDLGYDGKLDFLYIGNNTNFTRLCEKLKEDFGEDPTADSLNTKMLADIEHHAPEFYAFLEEHRGIPHHEDITTYTPIDPEIPVSKMRGILPEEEKERLRQHRIKLAKQIINDVKKYAPVVSAEIYGSTMEDPPHFGINSDIDIGCVVQPQPPNMVPPMVRENILDYYIPWRYAAEHQVRTDLRVNYEDEV